MFSMVRKEQKMSEGNGMRKDEKIWLEHDASEIMKKYVKYTFHSYKKVSF